MLSIDWDNVAKAVFKSVDGIRAIYKGTGKECLVCLDFDEVISDEGYDFQDDIQEKGIILTVLNSELPFLENEEIITTLKDNKSYEVVKFLGDDGVCSRYVVQS